MEQLDQSPDLVQSVDLRDYLRVVRERKWIVLLCMGTLVVAALVLSLRTAPTYRATATVVREGTSLAEAIFGAQVYEYRDPERELQTSAGAVTVEGVAARAKEELGSEASTDALAAMVTAEPGRNADTLLISAVSADPQEAAEVANAFARGFVDGERDKKTATITLARKVVEGQLSTMSQSDLQSGRGVMLAQRAEELGIMEQLQTGDYALSRPAVVPSAPFEPQPVRDVLLALAVGLVLGVGAAFALEYIDRRLKSEEAMEREFGLPVLAAVPAVATQAYGGQGVRGVRGFVAPGSVAMEAFRGLRSNLRFFEVEHALRTVLVTSAMPEEGKTFTTLNLGLALALSGSRVLVVDADLRRPTLHRHLGISNSRGLSTVLAGAATLAEVIAPVDLAGFSEGFDRELSDGVLTASGLGSIACVPPGPIPPNPAELLASGRMKAVMAEMIKRADYVLIDSPPLLPVSDAMPLATEVDGVLLAARMYATTVDTARAVRAVLSRAGGDIHMIGVVAGGVKAKHQPYYGHGYYQTNEARGGAGKPPGTGRLRRSATRQGT